MQRRHFPPLDGLRGIAFLMVFALHTVMLPPGYRVLNTLLALGHWGVDLFFCLSGFLITGILHAAKGDADYFRNFYARRAVRIFPLYYFFLVLYWLLVVHFHVVKFGAQKAAEAALDLRWLWWYGTNLRILQQGHYITASLNHFWTLAVEEHFYLVWPLLVAWLSRRTLLKTVLGIALGALILRIAMERAGVSGYVITSFTPCRGDSFCIGGAVSLLSLDPAWRLRLHRFAPPLAILFFVLAVLFTLAGPGLGLTIAFTCVAICFSCLIAIAVAERGALTRFLSSPALRFFGKYSYALYVVHWPIQIGVARRVPMAFLAAHLHSLFAAVVVNMLAVGVLSIITALLTWNLLEERCLDLKRFFPERTLGIVST